jgi:hypothetical protein
MRGAAMTQYAERTFDFGTAIGQIFESTRRNFVLLAAINLPLSVVLSVFQIVGAVAAAGASGHNATVSPTATGLLSLAWLGAYVFQFVFFQATATYAIVEDRDTQSDGLAARLRKCVAAGMAGFLPVLAIYAITFVAVFAGMMILIIPGVILSVLFSVAVPVQINEKIGVFGALARSIQLTQGSWFGVFGVQFVAGIVITIAFYLLGAILVLAFGGVGVGLLAVVDPGHIGNAASIGIIIVGGLTAIVVELLFFTLLFTAVAATPAEIYRELVRLKNPRTAALSDVFS